MGKIKWYEIVIFVILLSLLCGGGEAIILKICEVCGA